MDKYIFKDEVIYESGYFTVGQDWECPIPAFFILSPRRSIRTILEFAGAESAEYFTLLRQIRQGMKEALNIEDVYFFQNEDTKHNFHLWLFPRHDWMEPFGRGIASVKTIMEYSVDNMINEQASAEVKNAVEKMRLYLSRERRSVFNS